MLKKVFIKEGFSHNGERFKKGSIASIEESAIERLKRDGFIEDVATALGLDISSNIDLTDYVKKSEIEDLKGKDGNDGKDGYPTKEQWEALMTEKEAFITTLNELKTTVSTLVKELEELKASKLEELKASSEKPASLGAKATTKSKAKKA